LFTDKVVIPYIHFIKTLLKSVDNLLISVSPVEDATVAVTVDEAFF